MPFLEYAAVVIAAFFASAWAFGLAMRPDQRVKATVVTVAYWWLLLLLAVSGTFFALHLLWLYPITLLLPGFLQGYFLRRRLTHPALTTVFIATSAILGPVVIALSYYSEGTLMSNVLWVVIALASIVALWWLLKVGTAFLVPQKFAGVALLKQELSKRGISHSHLPPQFFTECVEWCERVSAFTGRNSAIQRKAEFVRSIEGLAQMVYMWRTEPNSPMFAQHGTQPSSYRVLFEKYELRRDA